MRVQVSFIVPVYNEQMILGSQLTFLQKYLEKNLGKSYEILLVENGSTDKTWKVISEIKKNSKNIRDLRINGNSYGRAIKHGILSAMGDTICILNVDFFDLHFIYHSVIKNAAENTVIIGSKTHELSKDQRSFIRRLVTYLHTKLLQLFFSYPGEDTHGIKTFSKVRNLQNITFACVTQNEFFDTELLIRLHSSGVNLNELPVEIREIRKTRYSLNRRIGSIFTDVFRLLNSVYEKKFEINKIINADDYGFSPIVNTSIMAQYQAKNIQKISLYPNLCSKNDFHFLVSQKIPYSALSLHFNLVRGRPISTPKKIPSLVNKNGCFYPLPFLLFKLVFYQVSLKEVQIELQAQYDHLVKNKIKVQSIDSEQHMHVFAPIARIVDLFARTHNLSVRSKLSTKIYLSRFFHKYLFFRVIDKIITMRYPENDYSANTYHAIITHPGNAYD